MKSAIITSLKTTTFTFLKDIFIIYSIVEEWYGESNVRGVYKEFFFSQRKLGSFIYS